MLSVLNYLATVLCEVVIIYIIDSDTLSCPYSSTDRMRVCGIRDVGSIPTEGTSKKFVT